MATVDMDSIDMALSRMDTGRGISASKTLYGWNDMGRQQAKITPNASWCCPPFGLHNELQEHVLQCKEGSAHATQQRHGFYIAHEANWKEIHKHKQNIIKYKNVGENAKRIKHTYHAGDKVTCK